MLDEDSLEFTFSLSKPPANASPTQVSAQYDSITGWLRRKPIRGLKQWEWRYFTLKDFRLKYYQSESDTTPDGVFNFNQLTTTISSIKAKGFVLDFRGCPHKFYFKAQSAEDRQMWLSVLGFSIINSLAADVSVSVVAEKPEFWKHEHVSNLWFRSNANTGDILLFQSKNIGAKIQRKLAGSTFDHVGMLLCYASGRIQVFEATLAEGVALVDWEQFFEDNWIDLYSKIMYRKLEVDRTDYLLGDLERFINNTKGKSFGFSARKMIVKGNKKAGQEEDFYCSELVASAYKAIGILPVDYNTAAVWPANFERDDGIAMVGAKLGPLMEIDFDLTTLDGV
jgi:hypothetical protein